MSPRLRQNKTVCLLEKHLAFRDVIRPPELFQFTNQLVPILHCKRTFPPHHDGHGDIVVGAIETSVTKTVAKIEGMATFPLLQIVQDLRIRQPIDI